MRWIGLFNIAYGALGLLAAFYLGRPEAVALCLWVIAVGLVLRNKRFSAFVKAKIKSARIVLSARLFRSRSNQDTGTA